MAAVDAPTNLFFFFVLLSFIVREILCVSQDTDHQHTAGEERREALRFIDNQLAHSKFVSSGL